MANLAVSTTVSIRLYRILLRQCRALRDVAASSDKNGTAVASGKTLPNLNIGTILLQPPIDARDNGTHRLYASGIAQAAQWWQVLQFFQAQCYLREESIGVIVRPGRDKSRVILGSQVASDDDSDSSSSDDDDSDSDSDEEDSSNDYLEYLSPETFAGVMEARLPKSSASKGGKVNAKSMLWCTPTTIEHAIRVSFRHAAHEMFERSVWHNRALTAYRMLQEQALLWQHASMYYADDRNVRITAIPHCIAPLAQANRYGYAYRILVEHVAAVAVADPDQALDSEIAATVPAETLPSRSDHAVQLLGRTWMIHTIWPPPPPVLQMDSDDNVMRVHAPLGGCVGQQPVLAAGAAFCYQSTAASSASGRMAGCLHFCTVPATIAATASAKVEDATAAAGKNNNGVAKSSPSSNSATTAPQEFFEVPVAPFHFSSVSLDR